MDDIACCWPSRPMVRVIMPPTAERANPVELLLCVHHFRLSQWNLAAAGAVAQAMRGDLAEQASELTLL
jgi:hypothetical protein